MSDNVQQWERFDTDTDKSFEAFCVYRDMGSNRSHEKVAKELGKSATLISRWASENDWSERISAYDDYLREEHRKRVESARLEVAENVLDDYKVLRKAIKKRLEVLEKIDYIVMEDDFHSLLNIMHKLDDYARRAVGLPSEIKESKSDVTVNTPIIIKTGMNLDEL